MGGRRGSRRRGRAGQAAGTGPFGRGVAGRASERAGGGAGDVVRAGPAALRRGWWVAGGGAVRAVADGTRLAGRFDAGALGGIEATVGVLASRWLARLPAQCRAELVTGRPTIDLDSSDVEVFGRLKRGVAYTYEGKKVGRPLLASWARTGLVLAGDLLFGDQDVRPRAAGLLTRALASLPRAVCAPPLVRADSGFFSGELAPPAPPWPRASTSRSPPRATACFGAPTSPSTRRPGPTRGT